MAYLIDGKGNKYIEEKILNAINEGKYQIIYGGCLKESNLQLLKNLGYEIIRGAHYCISWD